MKLEPMEARHFDLLARLRSDPEVMKNRYAGAEPPEQTRAVLEEYVQCWRDHGLGMWALFESGTGKFLGEGGLRQREEEREIELRFGLVPTAWGKGFAVELVGAALEFAFAEAGLSRVVAVTRKVNLASQRVLEKAGLTLEREFENNGVPLLLYATVGEE